MKHRPYSELQIDAIFKLRYGQLVTDDQHTAFATYKLLGRLFKCSGVKVRQLIHA